MREVTTGRGQRGLSKIVLIILILVLVLLITGGTVAALYVGGVIGGGAAAADKPAEAAQKKEEPPKPPQYVPIEPALVVNFDYKGRVGFLQANIQIMARKDDAVEAIKKNMPVIRNNLLMLLSSKSYDDVATREGKENLRQEALDEVNKVLDQEGVKSKAEAVYFTGFVMQ